MFRVLCVTQRLCFSKGSPTQPICFADWQIRSCNPSRNTQQRLLLHEQQRAEKIPKPAHSQSPEMMSTHLADSNTSLGRLVAQRPRRAAFFQSLGLDFCCGGERSLEQACAEKQIPVSHVLEQLAAFDASHTQAETAQATASEDLSLWTVPALVEHILTTHHAYLKENLPLLGQMAEKVERV